MLVNWKNSDLIRSSPNNDRKNMNTWTECGECTELENQSVLMPLLHCGKALSKMAKRSVSPGLCSTEKHVTIN